ncbi:AT-rich interactive domain-containing protein 5A isoform X2 [Denticeps clupeoides]|uniref:AT-rich interactive domain-containing protein 5A isoform X2 n=1 Tax=Denticeps clupeoides TaxID=299321 RepID=UPI0010A3A9BE|nr:AT-rich interactive domain-containing protein 5A-like isoform X2 [Denticeps clupeoides]
MVSDPQGSLAEKAEPLDVRNQERAKEMSPNLVENRENTKKHENTVPSSVPENVSRADQSEVEEKTFVDNLHRFMKDRGTPIERIPHLGFKQINLWKIFKAVENLGGYDSVTARRLWKNVYDDLGGSPGSTSAATCTRRHYERVGNLTIYRLVLAFERQLRGEEDKPLPPSKPRKPYKKSPDRKNIKPESKKRRKREEEGPTEDTAGDGHQCEMGACTLSGQWPVYSESPHSDHPDSQSEVTSIGEHPTNVHLVKGSQQAPCLRRSSLLTNLAAAEVISPLEKKKRLAQASLSLLHSPSSEDSPGRPSVIHCSPTPGGSMQGRTRNMSEGSPLPASSPSASCSRSASPYSTSSEDCLAVSDVPDTEKRTQSTTTVPSLPPSPGVCKPLSRYPNLKDQAGLPRYHRDALQISPPQPDSTVSKCPSHASALNKPVSLIPPPHSSFIKVLPKPREQWHHMFVQPVHKPHPLPHMKRSIPDDMLNFKKMQAVTPLLHMDKPEKNRVVLPKPLPSQQSLLHSHATFQVPHYLPGYDRARGDAEHQLKGLPVYPVLYPAHLPHSQTVPTHRLPAVSGFPSPYDSGMRSYPYSLPLWSAPTGYSIMGLQPFPPNGRI